MLRPRFGAGAYGAGSALEVELTLVAAAAAALPAVIRALARLGERGVGPSRHQADGGRFELERVDALGPDGSDAVVTPGGRVRPAALPWRFPGDFAGSAGMDHRWKGAASPSFTLEMRTPTFVRRGDDARGTLAFRDLLDNLLRQTSLLG